MRNLLGQLTDPREGRTRALAKLENSPLQWVNRELHSHDHNWENRRGDQCLRIGEPELEVGLLVDHVLPVGGTVQES